MSNQPLIELRHVVYGYDPHHPVLNGASLTLFSGERLALTGPTGSGKTTLLQCIVGLLKPLQGKVMVFGEFRRREADFTPVRSRVGLLFQEPDDQLFCPTLEEDVAFGPMNLGNSTAESLQVAREWLQRVGLSGYEKRLPHTLSGGQKRLAALAGLLAMQPQILLLDQPTNGLDESSRHQVERLILESRAACLIVSHDQDFLNRLATRQVELANGQLLEVSPSHPPNCSR